MLSSEILTKFETYVDDATELSSTQELDLLQKVYNKVWNDRPWAFAKKQASGNLSTSLPYIILPNDFDSLVENNQSTDETVETTNPKVVFIGTNYTPYQVVNWSDRRAYLNQTGTCYIDIVNGRLVFTVQPTTADPYEFDYKAFADTLTVNSTPAFPARFHDMLYHGMAVDDEIIQRFPKAASYAVQNQEKFDSIFGAMALWNAGLSMD